MANFLTTIALPVAVLGYAAIASFPSHVLAHEAPMTLMIFEAPTESVVIAAYDSPEDCEEIAWTMQRFMTIATLTCEEEK